MIFAKFIFHKLLGWKLKGAFNPEVRKAVVIVAPHTSWHDFYIGALARSITGVQIHFVGKKELFTPPFGWYFRWMGGTPIDRTPGQQKVEAIAGLFSGKEGFYLAMAPEGTRKKVAVWKTGYYYIALSAKVPVIPVVFNYASKTVYIHPSFYPTGNIEADTSFLQEYYKGVVGKNHHHI